MPDYNAIFSAGGLRPETAVDLSKVVGQTWTDGTSFAVPTEADQFLSNQPAVLGIVEILKSNATPVTVTENFFGGHVNPDGSALDKYPAKIKYLRSVDFDPADTGVFIWRDIQPTGSGPGDGGPFVWDVVDRYLQVCKDRDLIPYICLHCPPDWAVASQDWAQGEVIGTVGVVRKRGSYYYTATTTGTCGATPPTHTGVSPSPIDASDGGVTWRSAALAQSGYGGKANLPSTLSSDLYIYALAVADRVKNVHGITEAVFEPLNEVNLLVHWAGTDAQMAEAVRQVYNAVAPLGFQVHSPNLWFGGSVTDAEYTTIVDNYITTLNTVASGNAMWKYCQGFGIHTYSLTPANVRDLHRGVLLLKSRINSALTGNNTLGTSRNAMPIFDNEHGTNGCPCKAAAIMQRLVILAGLRINASFYYAINSTDGTGPSLGLGKYTADWNRIREILLSGPLTVVNILPNGSVAFVVGGKQYRIDWVEDNPLVELT